MGRRRGNRLRAKQGLFPGASLTAKTRPLTLTLQADGNRVSLARASPWMSRTAGKTVTSAVMQANGNLVLHGPGGAVWSSNTATPRGAPDPPGRRERCDRRQASRRPLVEETPVWPSSGRGDTLWPLDALAPKELLRSASGQFALRLQTERNLVLWTTGTPSRPPARTATPCRRPPCRPTATSCSSGHGGALAWESWTAGHPGARLTLGDDGNAIVRDIDGRPLWATGTAERRQSTGFDVQQSSRTRAGRRLDEGERLLPRRAVDAVRARERRARPDDLLRRRLDGGVQQGSYLDRALKRAGDLQSWVANPVVLGDIEHELNAGGAARRPHRVGRAAAATSSSSPGTRTPAPGRGS